MLVSMTCHYHIAVSRAHPANQGVPPGDRKVRASQLARTSWRSAKPPNCALAVARVPSSRKRKPGDRPIGRPGSAEAGPSAAVDLL